MQFRLRKSTTTGRRAGKQHTKNPPPLIIPQAVIGVFVKKKKDNWPNVCVVKDKYQYRLYILPNKQMMIFFENGLAI
jgi:hypothetical protein